jgi:LmbE family N-acetylglucosaminyl deacetylase
METNSRFVKPSRSLSLHEVRSRLERIVAISAHSDDVALSIPCLLKTLQEITHNVTLVTCFSRSLNTTTTVDGGIDVISEVRRKEEIQFAKLNDQEWELVWLDYADAPVRGHTLDTLFCIPPPISEAQRPELASEEQLPRADRELITSLVTRLSAFDSPGTCFLFPLGVGGHVDHVIAACAGRVLSARTDALSLFYEDLPYAGCYTSASVHDAMWHFGCKRNLTCEPYLIRFANAEEWKIKAAECYPSQISKRWIYLIRRYTTSLHEACGAAERTWRVETTVPAH